MSASSHKDEVSADRQPGHWLLASLGKKVLRTGGVELTHDMIRQLNPEPEDQAVDFAPGLGATARLILSRGPRSYLGVDRDDTVNHSLMTSLLRPRPTSRVNRRPAGASSPCAAPSGVSPAT